MFSTIETKILVTIFLTCAIALATSQVWGAGGLITTAMAAYLITGALIYVAVTALCILTARLKSLWQKSRESRSNS